MGDAMMIVHVQDLDITHSAESLARQEHDANFLDTSAGKGQEVLCSVYFAKPEVLIPKNSIPQDYSGPALTGL